MAHTLKLDLPRRTPPGRDAFDSSPHRMKSWLGNLPLANVGEATRQIYTALLEMNGQDLPATQRFKALELMLPALESLNGELKKHFVGQALPLSDKQATVARLTRDLAAEMATGYKIVAVEQASLNILQQDRKVLVNSLYRATQLLGSVLLRCYQAYMSYPRGLWSELHALYAYASAHKLDSQAIHVGDGAATAEVTLGNLYKQTLLLALACPYRLRHGVVEQVFRTLRAWAPVCRLEPDSGLPDTLFIVDLDSDQPPLYRNLGQTQDKGRRLALATDRLAETVRDALAELRGTGKSPHKLSASTLRRLMLAWGVMPRRRFSRTRDHAQIIAATGLSAIHYFLSGEAAFNNTPDGISFQELPAGRLGVKAGRGTEIRDLEPRGSLRRRKADQHDKDFRLEGARRTSTTEEAVARAAAGMRIDRSFNTQSWKMVNVSAGGYCLLWDNPETTRAQVGELVGIREQSDPDTFHWRLGIVRWMKSVEKRGLELGIQMLSPGAAAISAGTDKCKDRDCLVRGLLLPEIASINQRSSLLLPSPPFLLGSTARIEMNGRSLLVRLTKLVENTGSFAQFQFSTLSESASAPSSDQTAKPARFRELDDIWDIL